MAGGVVAEFGLVDDVGLAHQLAEVADAISGGWFRRGPATSEKSDGTTVSEADLAVDHALVDFLRRTRPGDDVLSEESGHQPSARSDGQSCGRRWILDPIDGTDPFLTGQRAWGTHVALQVNGEVQLAVLTRPTERRRWWAVRNHGAWCSPDTAPLDTGRRLIVSATSELANARVGGFVEPDSILAHEARRHAHWAEDPLGPVIGLLEARLDVALGPAGAIWDHAPQVLLTIEAGGSYTDRVGSGSPGVGGGLYTNGRLDQAISVTPGLRQADWLI